jgi:hypothetical protein
MPHFAVVQNGYAIFGTGTTEAEAIADARQWLDADADIDDLPRKSRTAGEMYLTTCTEALAAAVQARGGDIAFTETADGTVCLPSEVGK